MSTPSPTSPPKRPRLSLQIRAIATGATGRTSRNLAAAVDVKSPTSFNTLSNVYATAVDRSTPVQEKPPQTVLGGRPSLRLQTGQASAAVSKERRLQTPYLGPYLDTPITAQPISPAIQKQVYFPSAAMTATPPMSAVPPEQEGSRVFTFENPPNPIPSASNQSRIPQSAGGPRRAKTMPTNNIKPPYTHPRSLRSILRNSPLPPLSTKSPVSPRRQSLRLQEKAARRVAYNSPLTQEITTSKYTKSHIDLLTDEATPTTPSASDGEDVLDQTMAYTGNETRDGGQTPGPFEEMRRRMAGLRASTPTALSPTSAGGIRKRGGNRKKEKKRRWVWTIGQDGEDADEMGSPVMEVDRAVPPKQAAVAAAIPVPALPVASVPVLAVPLPRPRTRMQAALRAASALQQTQAQTPVSSSVPLPKVVVSPPPAPAPAPVSVSVSVPAAAVEKQPEEMMPVSREATTPEPQTTVQQVVEPPTPSVASVASTSQDSVFDHQEANSHENGGDVEMSDASSMTSDCCDNYAPKLDRADLDMDGDMDMDAATPIATVNKAVEILGRDPGAGLHGFRTGEY